ncbi:uncharacterized protein LOC124310226 [Neodiprion virginianus]|uniref:uncharacterized protein LOC124310226 n=1 Tax=Neodiprion virginianus TaxID=2961670 RepID=UPI001EE6F92D|nr:uncharacterized protein LOC124310226 [Neodiprion virginianus]
MAKQVKMEDIMIPIFDGANYSSWKIRIMLLLEYKRCKDPAVSHITNKFKNKEEDWIEMDLKARTIIVSSISDKQLEYVGECKTALEMITRFDKMYTTQSTALQIMCRGKIDDIRLTNYQSIEEFFVEFEKLTNEFKAAGGKIDESEKMRYLIKALPPSYSYIGDFLDVIPEEQRTVDYLKSKIKEKNLNSNDTNNKSNVSTFGAKTQDKCYNCGIPGHHKKDCKKGQHNNRGREVNITEVEAEDKVNPEKTIPAINRATTHRRLGQQRIPEALRKSKWDDKAQLGVLVGYIENGYRVLVNNRVINARHVQIVEEKTKIICLEKLDEESDNDSENSESKTSDQEAFGINEIDSNENNPLLSTHPLEESRSNITRINSNQNDIESESDENATVKRTSHRNKSPINRYGNPVSHFIYVHYVDANVPNTFEEALNSSDSKKWKIAMDSEIDSLK